VKRVAWELEKNTNLTLAGVIPGLSDDTVTLMISFHDSKADSGSITVRQIIEASGYHSSNCTHPCTK
jgi:hypothetical protein